MSLNKNKIATNDKLTVLSNSPQNDDFSIEISLENNKNLNAINDNKNKNYTLKIQDEFEKKIIHEELSQKNNCEIQNINILNNYTQLFWEIKNLIDFNNYVFVLVGNNVFNPKIIEEEIRYFICNYSSLEKSTNIESIALKY